MTVQAVQDGTVCITVNSAGAACAGTVPPQRRKTVQVSRQAGRPDSATVPSVLSLSLRREEKKGWTYHGDTSGASSPGEVPGTVTVQAVVPVQTPLGRITVIRSRGAHHRLAAMLLL